jgi:hypothetical protein
VGEGTVRANRHHDVRRPDGRRRSNASRTCARSWPPGRRGRAACVLATLAALSASSGCSIDRVLLGSNHAAIDAGRAARERVPFDGGAAECVVARSPGAAGREPQAFVLFFTGAGTRSDKWTPMVADGWGTRPVEVWGMNYPGSGGSDGPGRLSRVVPQALAVYDAVRARAGDRPIFVHAASFGTAVGLAVAARRPVAGLLLQNPPPLRQLLLGAYGWWNLWLLAGPAAVAVPDDLDALANAADCRAPAIFLLAGDDEVVPPGFQWCVVRAYAGPKRAVDMPGNRHSAPVPQAAVPQYNAGLDWLWAAGWVTPQGCPEEPAEPGSRGREPADFPGEPAGSRPLLSKALSTDS